MIFMGSAKYPGENDFNDHIAAHGGYCNAFTEFEYTNYQFKVSLEGLRHALDLQASLFADPLLNKEAMSREIKAVESEFQGNYPYDSSRMWQLIGETAHKESKLNCFAWGNNKSLLGTNSLEEAAETLWQDVKDFYKNQYSAERTTVVVQVGGESLETLREWVTESFGQIKSNPALSR